MRPPRHTETRLSTGRCEPVIKVSWACFGAVRRVDEPVPYMSEVTAEMIERGRETDADRSAHRRRVASKMREARERLTSSGSGQRTFDVELLRMFAERRRGATPALVILALAAAAMATIWVPASAALVWVTLVTSSVIVCYPHWPTQFLRGGKSTTHLVRWQRRFIIAETVQGMVWATIVLIVASVNDPTAQTFVLFVLLLVGAMTAMISASIPLAVYAGLAPISIAIIGFMRPAVELSIAAFAGDGRGRAALFHRSVAALVFHLARHAVVPGRKGRPDRRTRTGEAQFRRGAASGRGGEPRQIALPGHDEP